MNRKEAIAFDAQLKSLRSRDKFYYEPVNEAGLYIRVSPDSTMTWYYSANITVDGKRRTKTVSLQKQYPEFSLQDAKRFARLLNTLRKSGEDASDVG